MKPETLLRLSTSFLHSIADVEIKGAHHIPKTGPAIVAVNHLGLLDILLGFVAVNRPDATGWVADKHLKNPIYKNIVESADGIWMNRENPDLSSMREALNYLKRGRLFAVAPEGTRSPTGKMQQGKEGVAYLAINSGVPIIPGGMTGTENYGRTLIRLRKPKLSIRFGQAFTLPKPDRKRRQQQLEEGITEIMCRIAALIPEKYHGVYTNHPRIGELLAK
jgi:1-acyl-sn-glycerol-3-phosphate acyltransferase